MFINFNALFSTRTGCLTVTVFLLFFGLSLLHLTELFMIPHHERIFADNIGGRPQATDFIDSFLPVDVVYTWANGSG